MYIICIYLCLPISVNPHITLRIRRGDLCTTHLYQFPAILQTVGIIRRQLSALLQCRRRYGFLQLALASCQVRSALMQLLFLLLFIIIFIVVFVVIVVIIVGIMCGQCNALSVLPAAAGIVQLLLLQLLHGQRDCRLVGNQMLARQANALAQGSHRGLEGCIESATDLQLLVCCCCCCGAAAAVAAAGTAGSGRRRGWANKARGAVHGTGKAAERKRGTRGNVVATADQFSLSLSLLLTCNRIWAIRFRGGVCWPSSC